MQCELTITFPGYGNDEDDCIENAIETVSNWTPEQIRAALALEYSMAQAKYKKEHHAQQPTNQ